MSSSALQSSNSTNHSHSQLESTNDINTTSILESLSPIAPNIDSLIVHPSPSNDKLPPNATSSPPPNSDPSPPPPVVPEAPVVAPPPPQAIPPPSPSTTAPPNLSPPLSFSTSPPVAPVQPGQVSSNGNLSPVPPEISSTPSPSLSQTPPPSSNQSPSLQFGHQSTVSSPPSTNVPPQSTSLSPPSNIPTSTSTATTSSGLSTSTPSPISAGNSKISSTTTEKEKETKAVVGAVVGGVMLIAVIAIFVVVRMRNKRRRHKGLSYTPNNFAVKTDGIDYGQQQQNVRFSSPANQSYGSHPSHSLVGDNYGIGGLGSEAGVIGGSKCVFRYEEVTEMTNGFARQNIIGEGGFGCVYKGWLPDGRVVAVKQLKVGSGQGDREFKAEVEIISRVHHRHLVSLVGYNISDHHRMLIYEFVPNNTLAHHLHGKGKSGLDWPKRLKIAIGSAKGLAYLHEDCHPKIIHRDIKSANILLDDAFEAQVADFGLARLNDSSQSHVSTRVMGTFGYLAPEYASSGKLTDRSDVFSFGVVLLELITGRKPIDPSQPLGDESLVEWARPLLIRALETNDLSEVIDPRLEKHYVESEMVRMIEIAAASVRHSAPKRPRMAQVARALDSASELSDPSNGVKYGQSTAYDSGRYDEEIMRYRRTALGSQDNLEFDTFSSEYNSRDASHGQQIPSGHTSSESKSRAMN
ncbi:hypothetical protein K2173_003234 [Erythroxylum novogranatense]|uniref:non-specific serine/threonine protein kinase n=1 Tax=Erythroxylum novogranatense TaxID=1862640 RepID=A0AAV8SX15_9ROSI|nr:hypothetical protein K2173_003234 [Erythroxylum novogranatense]